jgi:hypothetical protein
VELDALPPNELRRRIREAIEGKMDREKWQRAVEVERVELRSIVETVNQWAKQRTPVVSLAHCYLLDHPLPLALLLGGEIDIRGFAGCGRIPANTQTIEREPAASFKPPPDQYQN